MANCKYCGKECTEGRNLKAHESMCAKNPNRPQRKPKQHIPDPTPIITPAVMLESEPEQKPQGKSLYWGYKMVTLIVVLAGVLQLILFDYFSINKWLLLIVYLLDLLFYIFLIWTIWRLRKKAEVIVFESLEEYIKELPRWALSESAPNTGMIGRILNAGKEYKQLVLVSKNFEPKKIWSEWNGFQFSQGNRAYIPPNGTIRGDVFFYNMDKKVPLIDTVEVTSEDAEDSFQLDAVWNQAFAVGHAAAMSRTQSMIQLILVLIACTLGALVLFAIYSYGQFGSLHTEIYNVNTIATNSSEMIRNSGAVAIHG